MKIQAADIELSEREKFVLRTIVQLYVLKASPIGSKYLSRYLKNDLGLSPASIRNVMSKLEEYEFISHPHTSAGRVPTDKGYRIYVDSLMQLEDLSKMELKTLETNLESSVSPLIFKDASRILGLLSRYLGIVRIPKFRDLIVEKLEIVILSTSRILVVLALDSNNVKTVTLETDFEIDPKHLTAICIYINEKISGKPLKFLKENFSELIDDFDKNDMPLVRLFVESVDKIFTTQTLSDRLVIAGAKNLLYHPEFENPDKVRSVIEIIENEDVIIHMLDQFGDESIQVLIGDEMESIALKDYSLVVSKYKMGSARGSIGLIGPKRMNYSKMFTLVKHVADALSH